MKQNDDNSLIPVPIASQAASGNVATIPTSQATAGNGRVSIDLGYPPECAISVAAGGKYPEMQDANGVYKLLSSAIRSIQAWGILPFNATFATAIGGYPKYAVCVDSAGAYWVSTADNNTTTPGATGANWQSLFNGYATQAWAQRSLVNAGGGIGQTGAGINVIYLGWSDAEKLKATVDITDLGNIALESWVSGAFVKNNASTKGGIVALDLDSDGSGRVAFERKDGSWGILQPAGDYATNSALNAEAKTRADQDALKANLAGGNTFTGGQQVINADNKVSPLLIETTKGQGFEFGITQNTSYIDFHSVTAGNGADYDSRIIASGDITEGNAHLDIETNSLTWSGSPLATEAWADGQFLQLNNSSDQTVTGPVTFSGITTVPDITDFTGKNALNAETADKRYGKLAGGNTWLNTQNYNGTVTFTGATGFNAKIANAPASPTAGVGGDVPNTYWVDQYYARTTALNSEKAARTSADSTLQTNITNEANARIAADATKANLAGVNSFNGGQIITGAVDVLGGNALNLHASTAGNIVNLFSSAGPTLNVVCGSTSYAFRNSDGRIHSSKGIMAFTSDLPFADTTLKEQVFVQTQTPNSSGEVSFVFPTAFAVGTVPNVTLAIDCEPSGRWDTGTRVYSFLRDANGPIITNTGFTIRVGVSAVADVWDSTLPVTAQIRAVGKY